ncbi:MAG: hypothetical protein U9Q40_04340, partial [Campylobacterota bacterium]|nr:hypothetical protein [Campylobacterota bacterium]
YTLEISKNETGLKNVDEILDYYKDKVDAHPIAAFISIFDHFSHTQALGGEINPEIKDAKNIVFCFGAALPNTKILAARPRSIGVAELEDSFVVEFIEAPKEELHDVMEAWTKAIVT